MADRRDDLCRGLRPVFPSSGGRELRHDDRCDRWFGRQSCCRGHPSRRASPQSESTRRLPARGERRDRLRGRNRRRICDVDDRLVFGRPADRHFYRRSDSLFLLEPGEGLPQRAHAGGAQRHPSRRSAANHRVGRRRERGA